ncbi:MAG: aldehyde dehydrogenase family protein [Bacteroidales bacterium]|nr:aldehyde dehydrogenase family protein [Bacteroidales bacterium]
MEKHPKDPLVEETIQKSLSAAHALLKLDQNQTDRITRAIYEAGFANRWTLAQHAHQETGIGIVHDKMVKNIIATRIVYKDIIGQKTVGIIREDEENQITEIARPMGPIFAVTPITNPTSTAMFKILITMKTRNPIMIYPHGAARNCTIEAARICYEAALRAGAPENCIQWIPRASRDQVLNFMSHRRTALVLATGSVSLVRAAYSSGNPAIGVGPGNVPVYIGKTADVPFSVDQILVSKLFDHGTICASEQSVVVSKDNAEKVRREFKKQKGYFLSPEEMEKVGKIAINTSQQTMSPEVIGQPPEVIARLAGITIPKGTRLLIAPLEPHQVGIDWPLSLEILAPILAFYEVAGFDEAIALCKQINEHGGLGHTVSIFSNDPAKIHYFAHTLNAGRIVVNTPSSQGAIGGLYNSLNPSLTLACGSGGKNFTTDNISVRHLLNIQRIAYRKVKVCTEHQKGEAFCCDKNLTIEEIDKECETARSELANSEKRIANSD